MNKPGMNAAWWKNTHTPAALASLAIEMIGAGDRRDPSVNP